MIARRFVIKGRVQGVGFRYFVYRAATELELSGLVRNLPNGEVEILAQGPESQIKALLDKVRRGPPLAIVKDIEVTEVPPGASREFSIER